MPPIDIAGLPEGWLNDAVLRAANVARIGMCVSRVSEGRVENLYANDAACDILGWSREVILSRNALEFLAPEESDRIDAIRSRMRASPNLEEITCVREDGTRVIVEFASVGLDLAEGRILVSFFLDASKRTEAERVRAVSEQRLKLVIDAAPDGIAITRDGDLLFVNPAAARLLGFSDPVEVVGRSLGEFLDAPSIAEMRDRVRALASGAKLSPMEYRARRADGSYATAEITSVPIEFDGAPAMLAFAREVTERAHLREQLARADRLASLGTLAAGVAHEINNPLTFMTLGVGLLTARVEAASLPAQDKAAMLSTLADVKRGAERVADIVRELTTFSRVERERAHLVDLRMLIDAAERIVAHRARHVARVEVDWSQQLPPVMADPGRLEQVFVNLLLNAAQAFEAFAPDNVIRVRGEDLKGRVAVSVEDNGPGIPKAVLARIFDPFFTTKPVGEGTGLGLAVCHGIVARLGGEILVESAAGRTVFKVILPVGVPSERGSAQRPATEGPGSPCRAVLVVDDEPAVANAIRRTLRPHHAVTVASSGEEALALVESGQAFDVVLCDLAMPGMTGIDLLDRVRATHPGLADRFVIMTGGAITARMKEFVKAWRGVYLEKPFTLFELQAAVEAALKPPPPSPSSTP